jgi:trimeric autotransporter adhesin
MATLPDMATHPRLTPQPPISPPRVLTGPLLLLAVLVALTPGAWAQSPQVMIYQGYLTDEAGEPITRGSATLTFRLYDAAAGGSTRWVETKEGVRIRQGLFEVALGESEPLGPTLFDRPLWLSIAVGDASTAELAPRLPMAAVPFSLRARSLDDGAIEAGENVIVTRSGAALRISVSEAGGGEAGWGLRGNAGTDADSNFVGTRDTQPLALRVNNRRALRIEPGVESPNLIGGYEGNTLQGPLSGVTIGGGGAADGELGEVQQHHVTASYATIGGGLANSIQGRGGTIGGGELNSASLNDFATIGGGRANVARGSGATVAGGRGNRIEGLGADGAIGGGNSNVVSRPFGTVPGGHNNAAAGDYAFAAGRRAKAINNGAFVWGDATNEDFASTAANQFIIRAAGGVGIGTNAPASPLTVAGVIQSTSGGFRFPDGTVQTTAAASGAAGWNLTGNSGTDPSSQYLGTVDEVAFEIRVRNTRALRIEPINPFGTGRIAAGAANIIGGHRFNVVRGGAVGATIGGGGRGGGGGGTFANIVTDDYGTVSGGRGNVAGDDDDNPESAFFPTVGGGSGNRASSFAAVVGGGSGNTASGLQHATVSGGGNNVASGNQSTVGGGVSNVASGSGTTVGGGFRNKATGGRAMVPGGDQNEARGQTSFAAGYRARAVHDGSFVWSDRSATADSLLSTQSHQFVAKASGGVVFYTNAAASAGVRLTPGSGAWANLSDRGLKSDFAEVDVRDVLRRVGALPVWSWRYTDEEAPARHLGPTAQDFHAAFGLGPDDRHITTVDADGVLFAAVQGLLQLVDDQQEQIEATQEQVRALLETVERLSARVQAVERGLPRSSSHE